MVHPSAYGESQNNINEINAFRESLKSWGKNNFQLFPWRKVVDPYCILIAEIMLHRTKANQVIPIYYQFLTTYPNLGLFLQSKDCDFQEILKPLGLKWRISLLGKMRNVITNNFAGTIPVNKNELLSLPGVSDYIASAVRCFAWNFPEALIDTNTVRIIGRFNGWIFSNSSRRNKGFCQELIKLIDPIEPMAMNYALIDLAHLVCLGNKTPLCYKCPLSNNCKSTNFRQELL